jgi:hypothetical protein
MPTLASPDVVSHRLASQVIAAGGASIGKYQAEHAKAAARVKAVQLQLEEHATRAGTANAERPGVAWGYAGDLEEVNRLLGEALRKLGGAE